MLILFLIVCAIFFVLMKFFVNDKQEKPKYHREETTEVKFDLPRGVVVDDQPEVMPLLEREKRRRKLLNDIFILGVFSRMALEKKQREDEALCNKPFYYFNKDHTKIICQPNNRTKSTF